MSAAYFEDHPTDPEKVILRKRQCPFCQDKPRTWQRLTDEEIKRIEETTTCFANESWLRNLTRNIEGKLKEKNGC